VPPPGTYTSSFYRQYVHTDSTALWFVRNKGCPGRGQVGRFDPSMPGHRLFTKDLQKENAPKSSKKEVVQTKQNTGFINFASGVDDYMLTDQ
jgi:hypothetical protein